MKLRPPSPSQVAYLQRARVVPNLQALGTAPPRRVACEGLDVAFCDDVERARRALRAGAAAAPAAPRFAALLRGYFEWLACVLPAPLATRSRG